MENERSITGEPMDIRKTEAFKKRLTLREEYKEKVKLYDVERKKLEVQRKELMQIEWISVHCELCATSCPTCGHHFHHPEMYTCLLCKGQYCYCHMNGEGRLLICCDTCLEDSTQKK